MLKPLCIIDLFSGCGGSALGFKDAGFEIKGYVEIDEIARKSFHRNFPDAVAANPGDITELKGSALTRFVELLNIDKDKTVILACPPCQGFSSARRKDQRTADSRNDLIFEFVRLVKEIQPVAFVMENVPGLARNIGQSLFEKAMNDLSEMGYSMTNPSVLEVADYGVPQKIKRLVVIGTRLKGLTLNLPEPTNRNPDKTEVNLPAWKTVLEEIGNLPPIKAGEQHPEDKLHKSASLSSKNLERIISIHHPGGSRDEWPLSLWLPCHLRLKERNINGYNDIYGRMRWDRPSPTITGGCVMISKGRFGHPKQNRAISLREAARLQTFPDTFIIEGNFDETAKQIGNAVPPLFAQKIAEALLYILNESETGKGNKNRKNKD